MTYGFWDFIRYIITGRERYAEPAPPRDETPASLRSDGAWELSTHAMHSNAEHWDGRSHP